MEDVRVKRPPLHLQSPLLDRGFELFGLCPTEVRSQGQVRGCGERRGGHLDFVVRKDMAKLSDGPRGQPGSLRDPLVVVSIGGGRSRPGERPKDCVHEPARSRFRQLDRLGDRGVGGNAREHELIPPKPENGEGGRVDPVQRAGGGLGDRPIQQEEPANRPIREVRRELAVPRRELGAG